MTQCDIYQSYFLIAMRVYTYFIGLNIFHTFTFHYAPYNNNIVYAPYTFIHDT